METGRTIKRLNSKDISKIAGGQVIVDLKSVVKELVENSLDAHATNIEVHLIDNGREVIEVNDNGDGIPCEDYAAVVQKYWTSKLDSVGDLSNIRTLGFRGEALSSICELCTRLRLVTRTRDQQIGKEIVYTRQCTVESKKDKARTPGTSVFVEGLFDPLPVRKKVFEQSLRNQVAAAVACIQQYAICCCRCRICVTNTPREGKRQELLNVRVCGSLKERLTQIYGRTFLKELKNYSYRISFKKSNNYSEFDVKEETDKEVFRGPENDGSWHIGGYCSMIGMPVGSSAKQYIYLNGRPIEFRKATILLNQIWADFEVRTRPSFILSILMSPDLYDINLTPDKKKENNLLDVLQHVFTLLWSNTEHSLPVSGVTDGNIEKEAKNKVVESTPVVIRNTSTPSSTTFSEPSESKKTDSPKPKTYTSTYKSQIIPSPQIQYTQTELSDFFECKRVIANDHLIRNLDRDQSESPVNKKPRLDKSEEENSKQSDNPIDMSTTPNISDNNMKSMESTTNSPKTCYSVEDSSDSVTLSTTVPTNSLNISSLSTPSNSPSKLISPTKSLNTSSLFTPSNSPSKTISSTSSLNTSSLFTPSKTISSTSSLSTPSHSTASKLPPKLEMSTSISEIMQKLCKNTKDQMIYNKTKQIDMRRKTMKSSLSKHSENIQIDNENAEEELNQIIYKDDFKKMRVVGQFNKGFIICVLNDDLYILDQHACDEKYNYESICTSTIIRTQPLFVPIPLNLTPSDLQLLETYMYIFTYNGFKIQLHMNTEIDNELIHEDISIGTSNKSEIELKSSEECVKVIGVPCIRSHVLGVQDVYDLLQKIVSYPLLPSTMPEHESPIYISSILPRPSRIHSLFASQACRYSIMIGTSLTRKQMKTIVSHLSEIYQPWNCPHGRPTIRHLFSMKYA